MPYTASISPFKLIPIVLYFLVWFAYPTNAAKAITVQAGHSIQAAIDHSGSGDLIVVNAGTYAEQLTIKTSGVSLVGIGAVIVPPRKPIQNICSGLAGEGTATGICIAGDNVKLAPFKQEHRKVLSVGKRVTDVSVTGFTVRNFTGIDIAIVGAEGAQVRGNHLINGAQYGALTVGSNNTQIDGNIVTFTRELGFIALCMDDAGGAQVTNNIISGYAVGLCVQTPGADVRHNTVTDCCNGAYVDPGVHAAEVSHNHISSGKPLCASIPEVGIAGIVVAGSIGTEVRSNLIEDLHTPNMTGAGIAIVDFTDPVNIAMNNTVSENVLRNNDFDIFVNTTGKGNVATGNTCSTPQNLCS